MSSSREDQQAAQPSSQQQAQQREPHHHALPPEQAARAVAHLKAALSDVASEEGATIAYGEGAAGAQPRAVGTMASDLEVGLRGVVGWWLAAARRGCSWRSFAAVRQRAAAAAAAAGLVCCCLAAL